jgi:hypothetical protein
MPTGIDQWARKLIDANQMREEHFLEVYHLSTKAFVVLYLCAIEARYAVRRARDCAAGSLRRLTV